MTVTSYSGLANDIAANTNSTWVIGNTTNTNGYRIYKYNGSGWSDYGGGATRIALQAGTPWVANSIGSVYYLDGTWVKKSDTPSASDIAQNDGNFLTLISKIDNKVYQKQSNTWTPFGSQQALAVSVDDMGKTWIASIDGSNNFLKYWDGTQWITVSGINATDVGAAENGIVFVASSEPGTGGGEHIIYKWNASCWARVINKSTKVPLAAKRLDAVNGKTIWFVTGTHNIYSATGS